MINLTHKNLRCHVENPFKQCIFFSLFVALNVNEQMGVYGFQTKKIQPHNIP